MKLMFDLFSGNERGGAAGGMVVIQAGLDIMAKTFQKFIETWG